MLSPVKDQQGFTLIEIVVTIVVIAISLTFLSSIFFASVGRSVEPILQIRAAEFSQALMDEILAKDFDENTPVGGVPACSTLGVAAATDCTAQNALGSDEGALPGSRSLFDDVDDYDAYCGAPVVVSDAFGVTPANFERYSMSICVVYDGDRNGIDDEVDGVSNVNAKLITVDVFPPSGANLDSIRISAYRGNF
ncbi:MAG: MSHA pilin protein MshD [Oceanicoccus sp.]|jgi:MSHA pilin protein MshD